MQRNISWRTNEMVANADEAAAADASAVVVTTASQQADFRIAAESKLASHAIPADDVQPQRKSVAVAAAAEHIVLMADEHELLKCEAIDERGMKRTLCSRIRECFGLLCTSNVPETRNVTTVLVTNRRIVVRRVDKRRWPGQVRCCFYMRCCCLCPMVEDLEEVEQCSFNLEDLRWMSSAGKRLDRSSKCCCWACQDFNWNEESLELVFVKQVGCFLPPNAGAGQYRWKWADQNKTAYAVVPIYGSMEKGAADELRRLLAKQVAANEEASSSHMAANANITYNITNSGGSPACFGIFGNCLPAGI